jgi:hypothetical protein
MMKKSLLAKGRKVVLGSSVKKLIDTSGHYYKHITIVNDDSNIISQVTLQTVTPLTDDARVIIYNQNMFIIQATGS